MKTYVINRIPEDELAKVRESDVDVSGHPVAHLVTKGGEPLRCCLRNARAGERAILFGYEQPLPPSPYKSMGAVFTHAEPCGGPSFEDGYPPEWYGRRQILRAYDERGWIHPATREHDGSTPDTVISEMFADPGVVQLHSHNVAYGCYMFAVTRSG